jgi:hypothetical protein
MEKTEAIFQFLKENRKYNKEVQTAFYRKIILPFDKKEDKIVALLHHVVNTQSQPKMDKISNFFHFIHDNFSSLGSFNNFIRLFDKDKNPNYLSLFSVIKSQEGWGDKTAALFCKMVYHLHSGEYDEQFKIWNDVPKEISENDKFFLPVDVVIIDIFSRLKLNKVKLKFDDVNTYLNENYKGESIEIWDDLWFWGFISQKTVKGNNIRELGWNDAKYWSQLETNKNEVVIEEIKEKVVKFLKLIQEK